MDNPLDTPLLQLNEAQVRAIEAESPSPLFLENPATGEIFALIRKDVYDLTCAIVGGGPGRVWDDDADNDLIAPAGSARKPA